ncbi:hypothetical protein BV898_14597 [Hypsibius exemplaris]|uniref:Uncharacterized protein n=1 Tax=Hypsibius exemplaris TaxID=2072580 RepID=A0A9X6NAH3_HYPEX|nr:hypothetical protein BV898_14597 [Hypsibius exemplaris]
MHLLTTWTGGTVSRLQVDILVFTRVSEFPQGLLEDHHPCRRPCQADFKLTPSSTLQIPLDPSAYQTC